MYSLEIIKQMNNAAVKKWYESERQKLNRLRKELVELEARVESCELKDEEGAAYELKVSL